MKTKYPYLPDATTEKTMLERAKQLYPTLRQRNVSPVRTVDIVQDRTAYRGYGAKDAQTPFRPDLIYRAGDCFTLDFGTHLVGYIHLKIGSVDKIPDSPLTLAVSFGEIPSELGVSNSSYHGSLGSGWLQREELHLDEIPCCVTLARRYAFRYVRIEIASSIQYAVRFEEITCTSVSSADESRLPPLPQQTAPALARIDRIGVRTLANCMQDVFEDGPKRDRRLWLGDLRLQAIANYATFGQCDLVKRCLYLFAGIPHPDGRAAACVFLRPRPCCDDWFFFDYSLFFISVLYDYYQHTKDTALLEELYPFALHQAILADKDAGDDGLVHGGNGFIDWCPGLDKQAALQGVLIYAAKQALELARVMQDTPAVHDLERRIEQYTRAARNALYDSEAGLFLSGNKRQASYASQVWMVLAGVLDQEQNATLLQTIRQLPGAVGMRTPYMMHHYIDALIASGREQEARESLLSYWGGMADLGADCFFEIHNPKDPFESPYGDALINSNCHAWSCTPVYWIRRFFRDGR